VSTGAGFDPSLTNPRNWQDPAADRESMDDTALTCFDLAPEHVVLEVHESLTEPGPSLELHLAVEAGASVAWWADDRGRPLGFVEVGVG